MRRQLLFPRTTQRIILAGALMASGLSLSIFIIFRLTSLLLTLEVVGPIAFFVLGMTFVGLPIQNRIAFWSRIKAGSLAGVPAIAAYDLSRWITAHTAATNIDPFAALPVFGHAVLGTQAPAVAALAAGFGFHMLNGLSFAAAYATLTPRGGILYGILWGLILETAMLSLYPGWLGIVWIGEFASVSIIGHVCYGGTLGILVPRLLRKSGRRAQIGMGPS